MYRRGRRGMKIGGRHKWRYKSEIWNEKKVGQGKWKFEFRQVKHRLGRRAPRGSGFPEGGRLHWIIKAHQYAIKTGPNTYQLIMRGVKRQGGWKKPWDRKWR